MMDLVRFASAFVRIAQEKGPEKPPYWGAWQALSAARGKPFSGFLRLLLEAEETWPEFGRWSELAGGGAAREYWEAAQKTGTYRATTQTGEDQVLIVLFEDTLWGTMEVGHMSRSSARRRSRSVKWRRIHSADRGVRITAGRGESGSKVGMSIPTRIRRSLDDGQRKDEHQNGPDSPRYQKPTGHEPQEAGRHASPEQTAQAHQ